MIKSIEQVNDALRGFADVRDLVVRMDSHSQKYDLTLVLADSSGRCIKLVCVDTSSLQIRDFGGGLSQFLVMRATDVRDRQLDRVSFHFADLERNAIDFDCITASVCPAEESAAREIGE